MLIVDKEPLGLRGEMIETWKRCGWGTHLVMGLRDVMDDPVALAGVGPRMPSRAVGALRLVMGVRAT